MLSNFQEKKCGDKNASGILNQIIGYSILYLDMCLICFDNAVIDWYVIKLLDIWKVEYYLKNCIDIFKFLCWNCYIYVLEEIDFFFNVFVYFNFDVRFEQIPLKLSSFNC